MWHQLRAALPHEPWDLFFAKPAAVDESNRGTSDSLGVPRLRGIFQAHWPMQVRDGCLLDALAFVLYSYGSFLQLGQVLLGVVPTEKKLAIWHDHSHVGLRATGVTTICGCQCLLISHCCVHTIIKAFGGEFIPTADCEFTPGGKSHRTLRGGRHVQRPSTFTGGAFRDRTMSTVSRTARGVTHRKSQGLESIVRSQRLPGPRLGGQSLEHVGE